MEERKDAFLTSFDFAFDKDTITLTAKKKKSWFVIILGTILSLVFLALGVLLLYISDTSSVIFIVIALLIAGIAYQMNALPLYYKSIIDIRQHRIIQIPKFGFLQKKEQGYHKVLGMDYSVKAVSGHTSAYEEGNTDYRKSLILETDSGEIKLFSYNSREESIEDSLSQFSKSLASSLSI